MILRRAPFSSPQIAPSHRTLPARYGSVCRKQVRHASRLRVAGSIFVGSYTAPAAGDYAIGANHVLPTNGAARFRGGLHTADFVRISTVQRMTRRGLQALAPT